MSELDPVPEAPLPVPTKAIPPAPVPVQTGRYLQAIELGHVLSRSSYFTDARDAAQAAVKVMIGLDLGVSPTAAMTCIHTMEEGGRVVFLIESKLLAAAVKARRPAYDYKVTEHTPEKVTVQFLRDGEPQEPEITWTIEQAREAGITAKKSGGEKPAWKSYPQVMLTWRALAEGIRLHFPELIGGCYAMEEFDVEPGDSRLREALETDTRPAPLADERAEELRGRAAAAYAELREVNAKRMAPALFERRLRDAAHSHAQLEAVAVAIEELRDGEVRLHERLAELEELAGPKAAQEASERADRRQKTEERIEVVEEALQVAQSAQETQDGDEK